MTDPSNIGSEIEAAIEAVTVAEPNTIYVLADDVLVLPCGSNPRLGTLERVEKHLDLAEIVLTEGIDRPWILRKATVAPPRT